ncbi:amidase [Pseudonocardia xinjiangensis]|uniref:Amidase n=1 Tax=Pseudonocardia xinjiangensis TaxID=75289 RepID=A0ABX1R8Z8_9PSEU|nr:amidase [Pseudonocardia xinjiangensis]NMH76846.1 amidase [Pseudonocardia xinjiangensis]
MTTQPDASQPHDLTALEQAAALRRGELSAVELVEHHLRRIEALDGVLGAFVTVTPEAALAQAEEADRALRAGDGRPLLGVPTAIKDLVVTAGVRTTFGSVVYADYLPEVDDDSARLLRAAGTISLGKTATPEFGLPPYTEPAGRPPAVTPWDTSRLAGGSSGGAGAATAGGLVPFAHGTDGGGSIRIPAAACGLVGLKTTRGLVSRGPVGGDPLGMSVSGPLARTVADAAAMLDVLAQPVPGETYLLGAPAGSYLTAVRRPPSRLRVGRYAAPPVPGVPVDAACLAAYERASALLAELGHEVVEFDPGIPTDLRPVFEVLWAVLAHGQPVPPAAEPLLAPLTRWWRDRGTTISGPQYLAATQRVIDVTRRVVSEQAAVDVVLTPMLAQLPRPVGWFTAGGDPAQDFERQTHFTPFTAIYNLTGQPALSLPVAWGQDGTGPELPVSVQLVGGPGADALLLALGAQLHRAAGWGSRRPSVW